MRVLLSTDVVGGVWDYAAALSGELVRQGGQVLLAVVGTPGEERLRVLPGGVEVVWRDYRLEWMPGAAEDVEAAGAWLREVAGLWGAELVHLNQMAYAAQGFAAPTLVVAHSDVLSWFAETRGAPAPPEWEEYARWVRRGLHAADLLVAPSAYQSALTERHYGRAADHVVHNGVAPPAGPPRPRGEPLLVSAGRTWDEAKGMAVFDRAVGLLGDAAPPAHLLGELDGPGGERFRPAHLEAHGRLERPEVDGWLERAAVYVGCSLYEPFGLAPLEAALRGCALVLSDLPSFRELWEGCALFFPRGDADALAAALAELTADEARRADLARRARGRALRRYTAARFTARYLELYRELHDTARSRAVRAAGH